jgi:hypothetical protein
MEKNNMKITNSYLKKYVKRMFGIDVDIKIIKKIIIDGHSYAGYAQIKDNKDIIRLTENNCHRKSLLFHEVGHLKCKFDNNPTENEYNAQMYAIHQAWLRGYHNIFCELIKDTYYVWKDCKNTIYARARKKILNECKKRYGLEIKHG